MKLFKWIASSFSMYSRIPMPHFNRDTDDGGREIMFLPLVGLITAVLMFAVIRVLTVLRVPISVKGIAALLVPLVITGGFHIDGFMDTMDALSSYRSKEKKLEIMKDPNVGSFAVIKLATAMLVMLAAFVTIISIETTKQTPVFILACAVFVISRALAGLTSLYMKKAKDDGMLVSETENSDTLAVCLLIIWLMASLALMAYIDVVQAGVVAVTFAVFTLYYKHMADKNFGGVTGDTAGYYVTMSETVAIAVLAISKLITVAYFS